MGTTGYIKYDDETIAQFIERVEFSDDRYQVLDSSVKGNVAYLAVLYKPTGAVEGAVVTIERDSEDRERVWLKVIWEDMGPYYYDCPRRIIAKLTPTQSTHAQTWRDNCAAFQRKKKEATDLLGKTIDVYGVRYKVINKVKRTYVVSKLDDGKVYRLRPSVAVQATVVN